MQPDFPLVIWYFFLFPLFHLLRRRRRPRGPHNNATFFMAIFSPPLSLASAKYKEERRREREKSRLLTNYCHKKLLGEAKNAASKNQASQNTFIFRDFSGKPLKYVYLLTDSCHTLCSVHQMPPPPPPLPLPPLPSPASIGTF